MNEEASDVYTYPRSGGSLWIPKQQDRARPWRVCAERDIDCAEVLLFTPGLTSHDICCHGFHDVRRGLALGREAHGRFVRGEQTVEGPGHERQGPVRSL